MNIAVISRSTTAHFVSGGMETQLKNLVNRLASNRHKIWIITTAHPQSIATDYVHESEGVHYYYIGDTTPGLNTLSTWEKFLYKFGVLNLNISSIGKKDFFIEVNHIFNKLNETEPFDLIVSQSTAARKLYPQRNIPIISIIHGTVWAEMTNRIKALRSLKNWIRFAFVDVPRLITEFFLNDRKFYNRVDLVIAVSYDLRDKFLRNYPSLKHNTVVIYNGVDADTFKPNYEKRKDFRLLYIGRMDREKGVDIILKAAILLKESHINNVKIDLVGSGVNLNELKEFAIKNNIEKYVNFHGQIENKNLISFYQAASVFVFPSRRLEGHPMTISEALCCGLPVISTKMGGLAELIDDNRTGFYIGNNSVQELFTKILALYRDNGQLMMMSKCARQEGERRFSVNMMVNAYEKEMTKLLRR